MRILRFLGPLPENSKLLVGIVPNPYKERSRAQFVLLDEPFSQIAPRHVATLKGLIDEEKHAKGILLTDQIGRASCRERV